MSLLITEQAASSVCDACRGENREPRTTAFRIEASPDTYAIQLCLTHLGVLSDLIWRIKMERGL